MSQNSNLAAVFVEPIAKQSTLMLKICHSKHIDNRGINVPNVGYRALIKIVLQVRLKSCMFKHMHMQLQIHSLNEDK